MDRVPILEYQSIDFGADIGRGTFGIVSRATLNGLPVAVKKFEIIKPSSKEGNPNSYEREVMNLSRVSHPNIIQLYGVFSHQEKNYIVMEYAENGCLHDFLHRHNVSLREYSFNQAFSWALQCAKGVAYLHSCIPILLHRDLKPLNLLLSNEYRTLKICDFGEVVELRNSMSKRVGTARWTAPEIFDGTHYDEKCDTYSWAIIFWELLKREIPYAGMRELDIITAQIQGVRPMLPEDWRDDIKTLITKCWSDRSVDRLSMAEVVNELNRIGNQ